MVAGSYAWWGACLAQDRSDLFRSAGPLTPASLRLSCRRRLESLLGPRWRGGPARLRRKALVLADRGRLLPARTPGTPGRPLGVPDPEFLRACGFPPGALRRRRYARALRAFWRRIAQAPGRQVIRTPLWRACRRLSRSSDFLGNSTEPEFLGCRVVDRDEIQPGCNFSLPEPTSLGSGSYPDPVRVRRGLGLDRLESLVRRYPPDRPLEVLWESPGALRDWVESLPVRESERQGWYT